MADKETKSKSSQKAETTKTTKAETSKPAAKTSATKTTAKSEAKSTTSKSTEKPATKTAATKSAEKSAVKESSKTPAKKENATPESVVAKYSNRGRKSVVVEEDAPLKKANKSENEHVNVVVEKHANSRGKKTSVVAEVKARKTEERYNRMQANPSSDGTAAANNKKQTIILWVLVGLLIASLLAGVILGAVNHALSSTVPYVYSYKAAQQVGYYAQQVGNTARVKPVSEIRNEGLSEYPQYGKTLSSVIGSSDDKVAARNALIRESSYLTATGTWNGGGGQFTWMDKDGYLYSGTTANPIPTLGANGQQRQLYKHTAAVGMYGGDVDDNEPGIIKEATFRPRGYTRGYNVTGVYAAAGEVIKIEISKEDMEATNGIVIHIGQALYNGKANNIWAAKGQMQRFPVILNTMTVDKSTSVFDEKTGIYTAYVGSFVGGPLYIRNETVEFSVTISGGVAYSHFILGYTTPEEFEQNSKSSAPYFDLEVWSYGVLHSGPKRQAAAFSYDDLYKAAVLWEKISLVSTTNSLQGIVFLYDPFVAAGAAVAFPGQGSVNCPEGWMRNSLNYKGITTSGAWGNLHEYHHNFQGYGVGNGGEVTNNGMTLVSYSLFTKISSARSIGNYGAAGMSGWNRYTSATWALDQLTEARFENGRQGLALYATLLHNFGPDNYIQAKVKQQRTGAYGQNYAGYLQAWQDVTHYDMSYYFNDLLGAGLGNTYSNSEYPMFVPAASVYQTGRGIKVGDRTDYIETMQPYVIPFGNDFTIDLRKYDAPGGQYAQGSIVMPDGFTFTVKNVSQPENGGKITDNGDGTYTYTPNKNVLKSGKIVVTLGVTKDDNAFEVDDIELVLGFEQTHEINKLVLERTTYTYAAGKAPTDAEQAFKDGYKGYESVSTIDHSNPTQNCNTDVWFVPDTDAGHTRFPNAPDFQIAKNDTVVEISGKLYAEEEGKYRVYLRGRKNCALFYSTDGGKTYVLGAKISDETVPNNSAYFRPNDENTYFDIELGEKSWLYIKEVLIVENATAGGTSYIGVGMKQWTVPLYTTQEITNPDGTTTTKYFNSLGVEVSAEEASNIDPIPPTISNNSQPYVNAFRSDYEQITSEFTSDYFYTRDYNYNYNNNELQSENQVILSTNYDKSKSYNWEEYKTENILDGDQNTYIHTSRGWGASEAKPIQFVMDMGEIKEVNRFVITSRINSKVPFYAKDFKLEVSDDNELYTTVGTYTDMTPTNYAVIVDMEEISFRYYRVTITGSSGEYLTIADMQMWRVFEVNGAKMYSPNNDKFEYYGNWKAEQVYSDFGHVMVGTRGSNIKFEFEGTRFGILSSDKLGVRFEVYIDGKKVSSLSQVASLEEQKGDYGLSFLCDALEEGKHTVTIKCSGEANIDAFVIYP